MMLEFSSFPVVPISVALRVFEQSLAPSHPGRMLWDDVFQRLRTFWGDRPLSDVHSSNIDQYRQFYRDIDSTRIDGDLEVLSAAMFSVLLNHAEIDSSKASDA